MSKIKQHGVLAGLVLTLAACAPARPVEHVGFVQPVAPEESTLIVQNDYLREMDIYAVTGSTRVRLGSVMTGATARVRVPHQLLVKPELQLQVDPVGPDAAFTFSPIVVRPGVTVELMVATSLPMSSYSVW